MEKIRSHENYLKSLTINDIALIRLAQPARLNPGVGVVCLPGDFEVFYKDQSFTLGLSLACSDEP